MPPWWTLFLTVWPEVCRSVSCWWSFWRVLVVPLLSLFLLVQRSGYWSYCGVDVHLQPCPARLHCTCCQFHAHQRRWRWSTITWTSWMDWLTATDLAFHYFLSSLLIIVITSVILLREIPHWSSVLTGRRLFKWFRSSSTPEQFSLSEQEDFELGDSLNDLVLSDMTRFSVMSNDSGIERDLPPGADPSPSSSLETPSLSASWEHDKR